MKESMEQRLVTRSTGDRLLIGREYECVHTRKGRFIMKITDDTNGDWVQGVIAEGRANAMCEYNIKDVGDSITIRRSHCEFRLLD